MITSAEVQYFLYRNGIKSLNAYIHICESQRELKDFLVYLRSLCKEDNSCHVDVDVIFYSTVPPYKEVIKGAL